MRYVLAQVAFWILILTAVVAMTWAIWYGQRTPDYRGQSDRAIQDCRARGGVEVTNAGGYFIECVGG